MAELNDVQALATVSTIVGESEVKVILSNSCFKAQVYLLDKLKHEVNRQHEICEFLNDANLKLKAEIQIAEQQLKSSLEAQEIIQLANIELNKDLLIAKGTNREIKERIKTTETKYENLWEESKNRYESLPHVQKLLQRKNESQTLYNGIVNCKIQIEALQKNIKIKKTTAFVLDKSRVLALAKFVSHDMKRKINIIQQKSIIIFELTQEIDAIIKENSNVNKFAFDSIKNKNNTQLFQDIKKANNTCGNFDETMNDEHFLMPKLQLTNFDLDINLEQLKIKKNVTFVVTQPKVSFGPDSGITSQVHFSNDDKSFENKYLSLYYKIPNAIDNELRTPKNYSKRKLINILDDIKLDKTEAYEIISRVDPKTFERVNVIVANSANLNSQLSSPPKQLKLSQEDSKMEIIEISTSSTDNILVPPSQFLDMTKDNQLENVINQDLNSTLLNEDLKVDNDNKKDISFDKVTPQDRANEDNEKLDEDNDKQTDDTFNNQLNNSVVSEEDFVKIKNRILKERHLDLSPQFVYPKNNMAENKIVTSKFFKNDLCTKPAGVELSIENNDEHVKDIEENKKVEAKENQHGTQIQKNDDKINLQMLKQPVKGLLFTHGSHRIPDSLNVSINTTVCDDGDPDYPQVIDSSLLLSPKELPIPSSNNTKIQSEEVPNFLSGFRKTGLFLFGGSSASDEKTENAQNKKSLFSFNFGSEEQKTKGFFNMFN